MAKEQVNLSLTLSDDKRSVYIAPTALSEEGTTVSVIPLANNYDYQVVVSGLVNKETGEVLPDQLLTIRTPYSPMYCTLESLKMVVETFGISDMAMRSYIREASKNADFIAGGTAVENGSIVPYEVEEFVRTKATIDCLLRSYMDRMYNGAGSRYKLDQVEYEDGFSATGWKELLGGLRKALKEWQDAIRGYYNEGRCKPKATRVGLKSSSNTDVAYTTVDTIINDFTRTTPQWS